MLSTMGVIMGFYWAQSGMWSWLIARQPPWSIAEANWGRCLRYSAIILFVGLAEALHADGTRCDQLASMAADPTHQASPVDYADIHSVAVIEACSAALVRYPENGRYWVQLGRGLLKAGRGAEMRAAFERARELAYPAAWFALAVAYHTGNGVSESDRVQAERLYMEAYRRGVHYAALGLARLYDEAGQPMYDLERANVWQSRFDAFRNRLE